MDSVVATILRFPGRQEIAQARSFGELCISLGIEFRTFTSAAPACRANATANLIAALEWTASQNADWHLFLEDDQAVFPEFERELPRLLALAERYDRDGLVLHNRAIPHSAQLFVDGYVVNQPKQRIVGSHGLIYRHARVATWLQRAREAPAAPIDHTFSAACPPERTWQIVAPAMMQHAGLVSTLHDYPGERHLMTARVTRETLDGLTTRGVERVGRSGD